MTCIVAIISDGKVHMAAERANSDDSVILPSVDPKIVRRGDYLFGYAGNTGVGQAVQYMFTFPPLKNKRDVSKHMIGTVVPALRQFFRDENITWTDKDDDGCSLLFGVAGHVFEFDTADFQMVEYSELAVGSGASYALGSLYSTRKFKDPRMRLRHAVEAAILYSPSCRGPIDYFVEPGDRPKASATKKRKKTVPPKKSQMVKAAKKKPGRPPKKQAKS